MKYTVRLSRVFCLLLFFVLYGSCGKSVFEKHAKGKVIDATDQSPVPFAVVTLKSTVVNSQGGGGHIEIAKGQCNKDGEFEIDYHTDGDKHEIFVDAQHYFPVTDNDYITETSKNRKDLEIEMMPKTKLLIRINIADSNTSYIFFQIA